MYRSHHSTSTLCTLVTASLWLGCGPMMSAPPAPPIRTPGATEVSHGGNAGVAHQNAFIDDPEASRILPLANYQFALRGPIGAKQRNEMGLLLQVGMPALASGGGYYRHSILGHGPDSPAVLGAQVSGGMVWAGFGLPAALRLSDKTWLTTHPSIRFNLFPVVHLPLGMSFEMGENKRIDTEIGAHFSSKDERSSLFQESYAAYVGVSFAHALGQPKD
jgi:hypothetical protein